jgi:hypothetical protein
LWPFLKSPGVESEPGIFYACVYFLIRLRWAIVTAWSCRIFNR